MEKVSARGVEFEALAVARLNQFRGLPANGGLPDVAGGPLAHTQTNADLVGIAAVAERAVAEGLHVENDEDRKPQPGRLITLVKSDASRRVVAKESKNLGLHRGPQRGGHQAAVRSVRAVSERRELVFTLSSKIPTWA